MNTGTCDLTGHVVGREIQAVPKNQNFDTSLTIYNVDRTLNIRATVIFSQRYAGIAIL